LNLHEFSLDDSPFRYISEQQIIDLTLISNENYIEITLAEYTKKISGIILAFFAHLKHLMIVSSSLNNCSFLSLYTLSPMTFSSSRLTTLCVNVDNFNDCLALLDGRLPQLNTLIIEIDSIHYHTSRSYKMVSLYFIFLSFIYYDLILRIRSNSIRKIINSIEYYEIYEANSFWKNRYLFTTVYTFKLRGYETMSITNIYIYWSTLIFERIRKAFEK
jgi:hypothetical protein